MKRVTVNPGDWKRQDWKQTPDLKEEAKPVARGKHASASLHRRWQEAAEEAKDWKKQSLAQAREIQALTADVNLIPAMKERIASLEMQLSLATCQEIKSLNEIVATQHARITELEEVRAGLQKRYERLMTRAVPRQPGQTGSEYITAMETVVNGEDATFEKNGVVIVDPSAPMKVQRRIGADAVRAIERSRSRR